MNVLATESFGSFGGESSGKISKELDSFSGSQVAPFQAASSQDALSHDDWLQVWPIDIIDVL